jgi:hypothetical protein
MKNTIELTDEELDLLICALSFAYAQMSILNKGHIAQEVGELSKEIRNQTAS